VTYKIQIDDIIRDANEEEAAALDAIVADGELQKAKDEQKAAARQAVLDKLGLTADEAAALLG
jgi:hypothetical protein